MTVVHNLPRFPRFVPTSVEPLSKSLIPAAMTTMPATNVTQYTTIYPNEFVLCLWSLLRQFLILSPCEFDTGMQALIPTPVTAKITQHGSCRRLGQQAVTSPAHEWAHLLYFPPFPPWQHLAPCRSRLLAAAVPESNRIFRWHLVLDPLTTSFVPLNYPFYLIILIIVVAVVSMWTVLFWAEPKILGWRIWFPAGPQVVIWSGSQRDINS